MSDICFPLNFRRAGRSDAAAVRQLTREVYSKWVPIIGREPMPMAADYEKAVVQHWVDLVEQDSKLIAHIEMIPKPDHLYVESIAVSKRHQGQGLATQLLQHAEALARRCGLPQVQLATNQAFADNLTFYGNRGYEAYEVKPFALGGIGVRFRKSVSQSDTSLSRWSNAC
jgi:GNAT superfamily N-acetyltransferase